MLFSFSPPWVGFIYIFFLSHLLGWYTIDFFLPRLFEGNFILFSLSPPCVGFIYIFSFLTSLGGLSPILANLASYGCVTSYMCRLNLCILTYRRGFEQLSSRPFREKCSSLPMQSIVGVRRALSRRMHYSPHNHTNRCDEWLICPRLCRRCTHISSIILLSNYINFTKIN